MLYTVLHSYLVFEAHRGSEFVVHAMLKSLLVTQTGSHKYVLGNQGLTPSHDAVLEQLKPVDERQNKLRAGSASVVAANMLRHAQVEWTEDKQ